jgi:hypothetical protein
MKRLAAIILSVVLIMGIVTVPASAEGVEVSIKGIKTGTEATFIVSMNNSGDETTINLRSL